ncbi:MAG: hypothetical protein K8F91_26330, partial [Candidatus Obscuribacterales bacterium]|nr:hypothetical protein [Candidatus Obscuribacterales bacterium]
AILSQPPLKDLSNDAERLAHARNKLNNPEHELEKLPEKTSKIGGTLMVPDSRSESGVRELILENGELKDAKTREPAGRYDFNSGSVELFRDNGEVVTTGIASDAMRGAVWKLGFTNQAGEKQEVNWITTRPGRIESVAELKRRAESEVSYAKANNLIYQNEQSQAALSRTTDLSGRFDGVLDDILKNGIKDPGSIGKEFRLKTSLDRLENSPLDLVRAEHLRVKDKSKPQELSIKSLSAEDVLRMNGNIRLGAELYKIENGQLIRRGGDSLSDGSKSAENRTAGKMLAGYKVILGDQVIDLQEQNQLVLEYTIDGDFKKQQIVGFGPSRWESDGSFVHGGLYSADALKKEARQAKDHAERSDIDYFNDKPYLTGEMANWYMSDPEKQMLEIRKTMGNQVVTINKQLDQLFIEGLSDKPVTNVHMDHNVRSVQGFVRDMNLSAGDTARISSQSSQTQKQVADVTAMAAITVLTAGSGAIALRAGLTLSQELLMVGVGSGLTSAAFRQTTGGDGYQFARNTASGAVEGLAMVGGMKGIEH